LKTETDDRTLVLSLTSECPLGGNPSDCQWHFLRELPEGARITYAQALTGGEASAVAARHRRCLADKQARLVEA
jgi:hypothetical protein